MAAWGSYMVQATDQEGEAILVDYQIRALSLQSAFKKAVEHVFAMKQPGVIPQSIEVYSMGQFT